MEGAPPGASMSQAVMTGGGFIGKDEFYGVFSFAFMMGHNVTGLRSLNIEGNGAARPASDAIYDICEETPSLHFMIKPGGKWMERALAIGMFAVPVAQGVRMELAERKASKAKPVNEPARAAPANDNASAKKAGGGENDIMAEFERAS